jgi:TRAP-type C4-dicarboxylate transport system permease small subunit
VELSSYMLAVFILLGVAYTQQVKGHVRVTMLIWRLPEKVAVVLDSFTTLLSMFIILILAWQGLIVALETTRVSDMLRIAQQPFRFLVSIAGFFLFLELSIDLAHSLRKLWGKQP